MIFDFNDAIIDDGYVVFHNLKLFHVENFPKMFIYEFLPLMTLSENIDSKFTNNSLLTIQNIYKLDGNKYEFEYKELTGNYKIYLDLRQTKYHINECCQIKVLAEYIDKEYEICEGEDEDMYINWIDVDIINVKNVISRMSTFYTYLEHLKKNDQK